MTRCYRVEVLQVEVIGIQTDFLVESVFEIISGKDLLVIDTGDLVGVGNNRIHHEDGFFNLIAEVVGSSTLKSSARIRPVRRRNEPLRAEQKFLTTDAGIDAVVADRSDFGLDEQVQKIIVFHIRAGHGNGLGGRIRRGSFDEKPELIAIPHVAVDPGPEQIERVIGTGVRFLVV